MKIFKIALVLLSLIFAGVAFAEEPTEAPDLDTQSVDVRIGFKTVIPALKSDKAQRNKGKQGAGQIQSTGKVTYGFMLCEEFEITCSNGTTDECCGSVLSCGVYCSEVCGGPCVYEGDQ